MIQGQKYYKLEDAIKAAELRTKGGNSTLYIYPSPSVNGLFVDWVVSGLKYSDKRHTATIKGGKTLYNNEDRD